MSYADAAGKGNQQGQQRRYFNDKMVVCDSRGIPLDKLVEALEENHLLRHMIAIQKVKHGAMYALASNNSRALQYLTLNGLEVNGLHLRFKNHKANAVNVYVANIPFRIGSEDIKSAFCPFGHITGLRRIQKDFHGYKLYTGDWSIAFEKLDKEIPSYLIVRGWLAYVSYEGQKKTCRSCGESGHFFANCPKRKGQDTKPEETSKNDNGTCNPEPENMDTHKMAPPNEPDSTEEEVKSTPTV